MYVRTIVMILQCIYTRIVRAISLPPRLPPVHTHTLQLSIGLLSVYIITRIKLSALGRSFESNQSNYAALFPVYALRSYWKTVRKNGFQRFRLGRTSMNTMRIARRQTNYFFNARIENIVKHTPIVFIHF